MVFYEGAWTQAAPTDGAIVPHLIESSTTAVVNLVIQGLLNWIATSGLKLAYELLLVWGLACLLLACSGSSKWLERGAKSLVLSLVVGVGIRAI